MFQIFQIPPLWNLLVNELLCRMSEECVFAQAFVNDVSFVLNGKFGNMVSKTMQLVLNCTERRCKGDEL